MAKKKCAPSFVSKWWCTLFFANFYCSKRWKVLYFPLPYGFSDPPTTLLTFLCISLSPSEARKYSKKSTRKLVNRAIFSVSILVIWKLKWNLNYFKQTKAKQRCLNEHCLLQVAQINCTANLNFGLMCKKAKPCWVLSTNFLFLFSW